MLNKNAESSVTFEIEREFQVPVDLVWSAWSQADRLKHWWGPKGCSIEIPHFDFRPGGFFQYMMKFEDAPTMWGRFNYREIVEPGRIVFLDSFSNEKCGITRAPFSELYPLEIQTSVTFKGGNGTTTLALEAEPFGESPEERKYFDDLRPSLDEGYGGTFERFTNYLDALVER